MKVYRGYDKKYGPITHPDWIYVTNDLEQAKWYASRDNSIKNGAVIEYEMPDNLNLLSINDVNNIMSQEDEKYTIDDLLWYQEGLSDYLYEYGQGIEFEDPKFKNHTIYIIFNEKYLKNGRIMENNLNEAYIKAEKGNIYYTKNSDMFLSMVKSIFISKNIPVRVYYDTIKQMYVFGNAFDYIHADLATGMKYYSNVYGADEMRANVSYLKQNCALFQVLPDDDFKKYDMGDGYTKGWFLKLDDLIFACRNKEYHKVRDEVPLFKDHIGEWVDVQFYIHTKNNLNESADSLHNNKTIDIDGEQKSIYNSRGEKIADTEESLRKFYKWFNNSKAVDSKNRPYVMYHGTYDNFDSFSYQYSGKNDSGFFGKGFYFTYDYGYAKKYGKKIMRVYLKIDNPYKMTTDSKENMINYMLKNGHMDKKTASSLLNKLNKAGEIVGTGWLQMADEESYKKISRKISEMFSESLIKDGYDGIMTYREYMVFNPNQIKSVKNNGNWSNDTDKLNESVEDKILYIIRGVPGSGKSTLAHKLTDNVVEADQYFYDDEGNYNWSADKLNQAHNWCFYTVKKYMEEGRDKIAVANTFVKNKDYKRYVELAKEFGYKVDIRTCTGNYQNIHNVPDETVEKMRSKFQETPLDESVKYLNKEYSDTKIITSNYDMRDYLNNHKNLRIVYDKLNKWYFVNDSEKAVHFNIMSDAIKAGFYNDYKVNSGIDLLLSNYYEQFVVFVVNDGSVPADAFDADDYTFEYKYDTFNIYDRDGQFINCPLYQILGIPNETNRIDGYNEIVENENNIKYYFIGKCNDTDDGMEIQDITHWDEWGDSEYYGIPEDDDSIKLMDTKEFLKLIDNQPKPEEIEYCAKNINKDIIWAYDSEGIHWFYAQNENNLFESAENDKTLRDYAVKLANICLDALVKTKYETRISKDQIQINIDKAFKKAVPILKYSSYEYFLLLVNEKDEPNPSFGKTVDKKYGLITFPIFSSDPSDLALSILYKHKSVIEKLYTTYSGDELKLKIHEYAVKYLKNEIKKRLENKKNIYLDLLIHECTHLLDDVRRTKTYKSKEQELKDDKGIEDYYNSPEEQNAYYQETISIFDKWANQSVGYKTFDIFWDDFIRQYKGEYNMLNDKNKRKLKKRAYAYWDVYMKD